MGIVSQYRSGKLIEKVLSAGDIQSPKASQALSGLKEVGKAAIPAIIQALSVANKPQREAFCTLLATLLDNNTLALYVQGLADPNTRIVNSLVDLLQQASSYDPNRLLIHFAEPNISEAALLKVLSGHKERLHAHTLLQQACKLDRVKQTPAFQLIGEIATADLVPELIARIGAKEPSTRMHVARILARFERLDTRVALWKLLQDPQKNVRLAALNGIASMSMPQEIEPLVALLKDSDITLQQQAVDALVKFQHPNTLELMLPILQDEAEYVRRAGVEVLNELADTESLKDLLMVIKDRDWWVRERAADALIKIGGPRVVQAMLELIKDKDEYIRRTAIEVINASDDPAAFDQLLESLEDSDWWVRERAIDALASMGNTNAVPLLFKALKKDMHTRRAAIRALGTLGDRGAISQILPFLTDAEISVQKETLHALTALNDEAHTHQIEEAIVEAMDTLEDEEVLLLAEDALVSVCKRTGGVSEHLARRVPVRSETVSLHAPDPPTDEQAVPAPAPTPAPTVQVDKVCNPNELKPGMLLAGRYEMIKRIGKGAYGTVLLFTDQLVEEPIIMKFINPQFATDINVNRRFIHEIRYARKVTHPNVIRIHDLLNFGEASAISMEYFEGHTLGDELKNNKILDWPYARDIILQITAGLAAAHQQEVVHRDIKPANILINLEGQVKVVDFGIAAATGNAETRLTRTGMVIGTPTYLAPEQVLGKPVDNRTDIYSLGVIMYQMLAGRPPYKGDDAMSLMYQHVQGKATALKEVQPELPQGVSEIVAKAMSVNPDKRYQSMDEILQRITALGAD